jgi:transposase, IS30 family
MTYYQHLSKDERLIIHTLKVQGVNYSLIAKQLKRNPSTILRELRRNSNSFARRAKEEGVLVGLDAKPRKNAVFYNPYDNKGEGYNYSTADSITKARRISINNSRVKIKSKSKLEAYILNKLETNWSPQQISGRMKLKGLKSSTKEEKQELKKLECFVSYETIYKYIYSQAKDKKEILTKNLIYFKNNRRRKKGTIARCKARQEENKKRIDVRPAIVETRSRLGDWEGDTIVGGEKSIHILTHVDRKSGYLIADKLEQATAELTLITTVNSLRELTRDKLNTITYDNGVQFTKHESLEKQLNIEVYFAFPYHSWERGTNENTNGLLRQYYPKKI